MTEMRQRSTPQALIDEYKDLSLRERYRKFYNENPPDFTVKKEIANRYGVTYFLLMLFLQYYLGACVVIPHMVAGSGLWLWILFLTLIFIQSFYNWFQCCRKYINKVEKRIGDTEKAELEGWSLCTVCQCYVPFRSHHCKLCKACILRHDHHCFFAAGCIGHFTASYFLFMCIWLFIAQAVALYWFFYYMLAEFDNVWEFFPPTAFWLSLTKAQPWFNFFLLVLTGFVLFNIVGVGFYLIMSIYAATGNVTFYEGSRGITCYRKPSRLANMRAVWGAYYWIRWLVPFYVAPEGNGYDWGVSRHR